MSNTINRIDNLIAWIETLKELGGDNFCDLSFSEDDISTLTLAQGIIARVNSEFPECFKRCRKCGKIYPGTPPYFTDHPKTKDGLQNECKYCRNAYNKKFKREHKKTHRQICSQPDLDEIDRFRKAQEKSFPVPSPPEVGGIY